jgi:hypothetical protein
VVSRAAELPAARQAPSGNRSAPGEISRTKSGGKPRVSQVMRCRRGFMSDELDGLDATEKALSADLLGRS